MNWTRSAALPSRAADDWAQLLDELLSVDPAVLIAFPIVSPCQG